MADEMGEGYEDNADGTIQCRVGLWRLGDFSWDGCGALDSGGMVQFQGSLQFVQRPLEGDPVVEHLRFRAEVGGCRWRIRTAQTDFDLTSPTGAYYSYAYDGVNLYRFCSLGPGPVSGKPDLGDPIQKTGIISRGGFPQFDPSRVSLVWIGLASKCCLAAQGNSRCRPVWAASQASFADERGFLKTGVEWLEDGSFPREIVFLTDGNAFRDLPNPPAHDVPYPPPFEHGFRKAHYKVNTVGKCNDVSFPAEFSLSVFNPRADAGTTNYLHEVWQVRGKASYAVQLEGPEDIRPEVSGLMQVIDMRSASNGAQAFQYVSRGWVDDADETLRQKRDQHARLQKGSERRPPASKAVVWTAFCVSAIAFGWAVLRGRGRTE